jgi:D-xylose transport system permease protein
LTVLKDKDGGPEEPADARLAADRPEAGPPHEQDLLPAAGMTHSLEVVGSLREYMRTLGIRLKGGESGVLPVIAALVLIAIVFQIENTKYLSGGNLVNILAYASIYIMFGMAETFALLLSEIDLSIAAVGFVGAMIMTELMTYPNNWPWWAAVIVAMAACAAIGAIQGTIVTRLRIPSFVVTLGGYLGWYGLLIFITDLDKAAVGGVLSIPSSNIIWGLVNKQMSPAAGWIVLAAAVAVFGVYMWARDARRRSQNLSAPPKSITAVIIGGVAACGVLLVWICNINRGTVFAVQEGMPYFVPVVVVIVAAWTIVCGRTRFGRYIYAIGANPEAARRAGVNVARVRTAAFMMCSLTAGFAGVLFASRQFSMSITVTAGSFTLLGVAAAVIGGTSLFGGRGKPSYSVLGGLTVAALYFGLYLLGVSADGTYMAIAVMLVAAAAVDTLVRRRGSTSAV